MNTSSIQDTAGHDTAARVVAGHDLRGRNIIVTGGTNGIGAETARAFASAGARVLIAGRDSERGTRLAAAMAAETAAPVEFDQLDLSSLASVRAFAARHIDRPLHVLVNNAGIMATPLTYTADGFEAQFGVNHLGHFALTEGLLPALRAAGGARVVTLSSRGHRRSDVDFDDPHYRVRSYDPWRAYGQSKSANALFAVGLTRRHADDGIVANAVMPGAIHTGLTAHLNESDLLALGWSRADGELRPPAHWKSVEQGAATSVWAAIAPELEGRGGLYLDGCAVGRPWTRDEVPPMGCYLPRILDPGRAERLWELSERATRG
jgi:NAD(P)-dependent dehydrogenase (short-subunit alcohol dehydrogenase family)